MTRLLLALVGVILLAITALGAVWLLGQMLLGVGALAVGTAGVLLKLLWFLVVGSLLGGAVYFVSNAWRPLTPSAPARSIKASSQAAVISADFAPPQLQVEAQSADNLAAASLAANSLATDSLPADNGPHV